CGSYRSGSTWVF
nr:immunoglobulin light chain junction region [Macaca mulatta]MPN65344.1 immunoglobulin light chain junction region [Macaca mulatta]MPN65440.1 immunoglobulin light chain junction region [Macaca mulatta]MPN65461.1 immunoglobulin light chain junction region [Macaca mulatta]MPN65719.1 immunoglobulin light chain junction region [Macaca mulatta]